MKRLKKTRIRRLISHGGWAWLKSPGIPRLAIPKLRCAVFAHVAFQHAGIGLAQIDGDQAIQGVGEAAVDVEGHQFADQLQILLQQHWRAFAIRAFHRRKQLTEQCGDNVPHSQT